ncbi:hypothetical protein [Dactylosporangium sp. NPDC048998]|uniref:hypothetical protein n=1 Tax=Dactylosporangium sp. NPDC048998 TaxID=3363976 RepID=UPI003717BA3D
MRRHADRVTDAQLHNRTVRRRLLTGAGAAGAALLAGGPAAPGEPAGAAPSTRTNLM